MNQLDSLLRAQLADMESLLGDLKRDVPLLGEPTAEEAAMDLWRLADLQRRNLGWMIASGDAGRAGRAAAWCATLSMEAFNILEGKVVPSLARSEEVADHMDALSGYFNESV